MLLARGGREGREDFMCSGSHILDLKIYHSSKEFKIAIPTNSENTKSCYEISRVKT